MFSNFSSDTSTTGVSLGGKSAALKTQVRLPILTIAGHRHPGPHILSGTIRAENDSDVIILDAPPRPVSDLSVSAMEADTAGSIVTNATVKSPSQVLWTI